MTPVENALVLLLVHVLLDLLVDEEVRVAHVHDAHRTLRFVCAMFEPRALNEGFRSWMVFFDDGRAVVAMVKAATVERRPPFDC